MKETFRKIASQEEEFLNFLRLLMTAGLPLMKNLLKPLAKSVLLPFRLTTGMTAANVAIQKKIYVYNINNLKQRNGRYENS